MKTKSEWEQDILQITTKIYSEYPELVKYFKEIPVPNSSATTITASGLKDYYTSLVDLLGEYAKTHPKTVTKSDKKGNPTNGYPMYPENEDIYVKGKKEMELNPEDPSKKKIKNASNETRNEKDFKLDKSGDDLDVPDAELDDEMEEIGSEDEENNYYGLGGDAHNDLDENDAE